MPASAERVGIDMELKTLATVFDGQKVQSFENVKALKKHEQRLVRYQQGVKESTQKTT